VRPAPLPAPGPFPRVDERDTIFSRARLKLGSRLYQRYYARRPELQRADDRSRSLRPLATPGGLAFQALEAALTQGCFDASDLIARAVEGDEGGGASTSVASGVGPGEGEGCWPRLDPGGDREACSAAVKAAARFLGAVDVGITALEPGFVYSHRGRPVERHGAPITLEHGSAIVLVFPMREPWVGTSPELAATAETARAYQQTGAACFALARALKRLGVDARAHIDSNYLVMCSPLAVQAGLGELGRNGLLIHRALGPGVRLGVVTTDAQLAFDDPACLGVGSFCGVCAKCAEHCPSSAIPRGAPQRVRGVDKWPLAAERCYHYWRAQGSDCGVCVRSCPFHKPDTALHRWVRGLIRRTTAFNRLLLLGDDLFYPPRAGTSPFPPPPLATRPGAAP
jgi:reductive dehalogenase